MSSKEVWFARFNEPRFNHIQGRGTEINTPDLLRVGEFELESGAGTDLCHHYSVSQS